MARLATLARQCSLVLAVLLVGCGGPAGPGPSAAPLSLPVHPDATADADLFVVVTEHELDTLVGIDVEARTLTRLAVLQPNPLRPVLDGGMASMRVEAAVLTGPTSPDPLLWTTSMGAEAVVRTIHRASGELLAFDAPGAGDGWMPFLADGVLGWATFPAMGDHRLIGAGGAFEIDLPGEVQFVVAGPGTGRVTAVVEPPSDDHDLDVVVIDLARKTVTTLPIDPAYVGGIWADATTLAISDSGFSHRAILTWDVDASGSNPDAVGGLVRGPTLTTAGPEPALVAGGEGFVVASTGGFDRSIVEAFDPHANESSRRFQLEKSCCITAMSVLGSTLVIMENPEVIFIDLNTGEVETVELVGATRTSWVVAP